MAQWPQRVVARFLFVLKAAGAKNKRPPRGIRRVFPSLDAVADDLHRGH